MYLQSFKYLFVALIFIAPGFSRLHGEITFPEFYFPLQDTIIEIEEDTVLQDTLIPNLQDSVQKKEKSKEAIDAPVNYSADDSIITDMSVKKVFLYGNAEVTYLDIKLNAAYIEFDMADETVYATGLEDTTGQLAGLPEFTQGSESFRSRELTYNFNTEKGIIREIKTEQEGGYLHSRVTKKHPSGEIHLKDGKYTTCDADHPHFYLALTKGISIPDDKIVSGPAYVVVEDVPLPIGIPFGFFPSTKTSTSGILLPSYGEEQNRGFYLRGGGYYFALSDNFDLRLNGDIYSRGSWGLSATSNYIKRYKFSGSFSGRYYENVSGEKELPDYSRSKDFSIQWTHSQDAKANPTQRFGASVDFSSRSYDKNHSYDMDSYLSNTKRSSVSYSKSWPGSPFNLSSSANISQNSKTGNVDMDLPSISFTMNTIYPFQSKSGSGKRKWYDNVQFSYSSSVQNRVMTNDSLLFTENMFDDLSNGFQHSIPLSTNFKFLRFFNLSPSLNYKGVLYTSSIEKRWEAEYYDPVLDSVYGAVITDTIPGFRYAHAAFPSVSLSAQPKLYGMYQFTNPNSKVIAIRHVMSPSASISFTPDLNEYMPDYYKEVQVDTAGNTRTYSVFEGYMFGTPIANGRSGSINFSLRNTLEMKVRSRADTAEAEPRKISVLDNFDFSSSYNPFADSLKLRPISFNTGTRLKFGNINIRLNGTFDPYKYTETDGRYKKINKFVWEDGNLPRLTSASLSLSMGFNSKEGGAANKTAEPNQPMPGDLYYNDYVDFNIPWSLNMSLDFSYNKPYDVVTFTKSLRTRGDVSLTEKWKIGFSSGYDFEAMEFTPTSINVFRDLHCWQMRFTVVPFGFRQSYNFTINVKASILKDLKYEKRKSWYDRL